MSLDPMTRMDMRRRSLIFPLPAGWVAPNWGFLAFPIPRELVKARSFQKMIDVLAEHMTVQPREEHVSTVSVSFRARLWTDRFGFLTIGMTVNPTVVPSLSELGPRLWIQGMVPPKSASWFSAAPSVGPDDSFLASPGPSEFREIFMQILWAITAAMQREVIAIQTPPADVSPTVEDVDSETRSPDRDGSDWEYLTAQNTDEEVRDTD